MSSQIAYLGLLDFAMLAQSSRKDALTSLIITSRATVIKLRPIWIWGSVFWLSWMLMSEARNLTMIWNDSKRSGEFYSEKKIVWHSVANHANNPFFCIFLLNDVCYGSIAFFCLQKLKHNYQFKNNYLENFVVSLNVGMYTYKGSPKYIKKHSHLRSS